MNIQKNPAVIKNIRSITVSGRIGTGKTTLANHIAEALSWKVLDGGLLVRKFMKASKISINETLKRPDKFDLELEEDIKKLLKEKSNYVMQSHLAGFDAKGIDGVYKILVVCNDDEGKDKQSIRIDRLVNRDLISVEEAKKEVHQREDENLTKYRRMYANNDESWVYWDPKYYDLVVNTYSFNQKDALSFVLDKIGFKR